MKTPSAGELTVSGASVRHLYDLYLSDRLRVNRRYQRKLVWNVEEKQRLIDSLLENLPVPLFFMASTGSTDGAVELELIDGMQRLNAIFSFIENEFSTNGAYFNLSSLGPSATGVTRTSKVQQREPTMPEEGCARLLDYTLALSVFRPKEDAAVSEVFRRINSGGRRLSRQNIRQAGTLSPLADLVRVISSRIRGDISPGDAVAFRVMPQLSITNRGLNYGVQVDDIFWVHEELLQPTEVRESADEQLVLDIIADFLMDPLTETSTRMRDQYYGYTSIDHEHPTTPSYTEINAAIEAYDPRAVEDHFMHVYDIVRSILAQDTRTFASLVNCATESGSRRCFHATFLAIYELTYKEGMRLGSPLTAWGHLNGMGSLMTDTALPTHEDDWQQAPKRRTVDAIKGILRDAFELREAAAHNLGRYGWASQLEKLMGNAIVEQQSFDCKQGFLRLDTSRQFDEKAFTKICRTITAIANTGPRVTGYIAVGIADNEQHAERVKELDSVHSERFRGFHVVGIEREAPLVSRSLNDYWMWLCQLLKSSGLDPDLAGRVTAESKLVNYRGRMVALLHVSSGTQPYFFENTLLERSGSETLVVEQNDYFRVFQRFTTAPR
ncbi:DUF262 domain-containing protein [Streptomyces murinus]|uniref:DUF262 domain-containing protein n=1 Tax=Streptomyces murinus TaxID=33900 RepID=UPI0033C16A0D